MPTRPVFENAASLHKFESRSRARSLISSSPLGRTNDLYSFDAPVVLDDTYCTGAQCVMHSRREHMIADWRVAIMHPAQG